MAKNNAEKDLILSYYEEGGVVISTLGLFVTVDMQSFISQPTEGILYDLNLTEASILTCMEDSWINDYAAARVIRALKEKIESLEEIISHHEYRA